MSIMRCPACERFIDTDYEAGEEVKGQWLCGNCASEQDAEDEGPPSSEAASTPVMSESRQDKSDDGEHDRLFSNGGL